MDKLKYSTRDINTSLRLNSTRGVQRPFTHAAMYCNIVPFLYDPTQGNTTTDPYIEALYKELSIQINSKTGRPVSWTANDLMCYIHNWSQLIAAFSEMSRMLRMTVSQNLDEISSQYYELFFASDALAISGNVPNLAFKYVKMVRSFAKEYPIPNVAIFKDIVYKFSNLFIDKVQSQFYSIRFFRGKIVKPTNNPDWYDESFWPNGLGVHQGTTNPCLNFTSQEQAAWSMDTVFNNEFTRAINYFKDSVPAVMLSDMRGYVEDRFDIETVLSGISISTGGTHGPGVDIKAIEPIEDFDILHAFENSRPVSIMTYSVDRPESFEDHLESGFDEYYSQNLMFPNMTRKANSALFSYAGSATSDNTLVPLIDAFNKDRRREMTVYTNGDQMGEKDAMFRPLTVGVKNVVTAQETYNTPNLVISASCYIPVMVEMSQWTPYWPYLDTPNAGGIRNMSHNVLISYDMFINQDPIAKDTRIKGVTNALSNIIAASNAFNYIPDFLIYLVNSGTEAGIVPVNDIPVQLNAYLQKPNTLEHITIQALHDNVNTKLMRISKPRAAQFNKGKDKAKDRRPKGSGDSKSE